MGLTEKGFKRRRYPEIIERMEGRAKDLFSENVNLSERSPLGLFLRVVAWSIALVWQLAENVYNSAFVDTAQGVDLDRVATYIGITRRPATHAEGTAVVTGEEEASVSSGTQFQTEDGLVFYVEGNWSIPEGESSVEVDIRAMEPGTEYNVPASTIVEFVDDPPEGLTDVTNPEPTSGGLEPETDAELRERYLDSVAKPGASTVDSIRAALLDKDGVRAALVVVNSSIETDADGRPPKSIESYVLGGDSADVAATILDTKAAGIQAYGTEEETVEDDAGQEHTIGFTYADEVKIEVDVTVTTNEEYPEDGDDKMVTEIIKYIGGEDEDGSVYAGLSMGEDVIYTQIIKACYKVSGVDDVDVTINKEGEDAGTDNISIELTEVAETDYEKVGITHA